MTQSQQGPGAAAFLLLAEGHLRKAKEMLESHPMTVNEALALNDTQWAAGYVRQAQELLKEEEE